MDRESPQQHFTRRDFMCGSLAAGALPLVAPALGKAAESKPAETKHRKIKIGVVGCGGRGAWIAKLFKQHGGYEFHAVADYFQPVAEPAAMPWACPRAPILRPLGLQAGDRQRRRGRPAGDAALLLPRARQGRGRGRAARLHGQAGGRRRARLPGDRGRRQAGHAEEALLPGRLPDAHRSRSTSRCANGFARAASGKLAYVQTFGYCGGFADPPLTKTIESRLRSLIWVNDVAIGGDYIVNFDIHAIDAALWVVGQRPVSRRGRLADLPARPARRRPRRLLGGLRVRRRLGAEPRGPRAPQQLGRRADLPGLRRRGQRAGELLGQGFRPRRPETLRRRRGREPLRGRRRAQHRRLPRDASRRASSTTPRSSGRSTAA